MATERRLFLKEDLQECVASIWAFRAISRGTRTAQRGGRISFTQVFPSIRHLFPFSFDARLAPSARIGFRITLPTIGSFLFQCKLPRGEKGINNIL